MITYLINFVLCSGVLLLVYRVFLRNENLYKFNRFYLLFSMVFSLVVPFMTIHVQQMPLPVQQFDRQVSTTITAPVYQPVVDKTTSVILNTTVYQQEGPAITPANLSTPVPQHTLGRPLDYLPQALICLYLIAFMALLIRFIRNSYHISRKVAKNTIITHHDTSLVLLEEEVTPHSFLKYIFINKKDYREGAIEPEIICHEQAHVRQLHSLDVILVELLQVICWFNPFIPLYRKAIQLNHEFLADEAVVKNYNNTPSYQYLLLTKASQVSSLSLTSPFNYQITKKRLAMMTKTTSVATAWFARLAIIPVIAVTFLLFCNKTIAATKPALVKQQTDSVKFPVPHDSTIYTAAHWAGLTKQIKAYVTYQQTDDAKHKRKLAQAIWGKTINVKITGGFKDKNDKFIGILAKHNNDEYLIETSHDQEKQLNNLLKAGDEVTINVYGTNFYYIKDRPVGIVPAYVMKADKKIFQLSGVAEADRILGYPANKVHFQYGQIVNLVKKVNGKWTSAQYETVTGYHGYAFHDKRFLGRTHIDKKIKKDRLSANLAE